MRHLLVLGMVLALCGCLSVSHSRAPRTATSAAPPRVFQGLYKMRAEGEGGRIRARVWIGVDADEQRIAAEVLGPMGGTKAQFDGNLERTRAYLVERGVFTEGPSSPDTSRSILGVPLTVSELTHFFRGRRPGGGRISPAYLRTESGEWRIDWSLGDHSLPAWLLFSGPRGTLRLDLVRLSSSQAVPEPFPQPARAKKVEPSEFQAMFLP